MKFRLVEYQDFPSADKSVADSEKEYKNDIKNAKTSEEKDEKLKSLISFWANDGKISKNLLQDSYKDIRDVLLSSLESYGYGNTTNIFLRYILDNSDVIRKEDAPKMSILQSLFNLGLIDYNNKSKEWFSDRYLYERPDDEFEYTVKIFDIANNKSKISQWFKDTSYQTKDGKKKYISTDDLYFNGKIKDSGLHDHENKREQNIWNQVELWANKVGEIDKENSKGSDKKKYSLNDLFRQSYGLQEDSDVESKIDIFTSMAEKLKIIPEDKINLFKAYIKNNMRVEDAEKMFRENRFVEFNNKEMYSLIYDKFKDVLNLKK